MGGIATEISELEKQVKGLTSSKRDTELEIFFYNINQDLQSHSSKGTDVSIYNAQLIGLKSVYELKCQLWGNYEIGPEGFVKIEKPEPPIIIDDEDLDLPLNSNYS